MSTERDARLIAGYFFDNCVDQPDSERGAWVDRKWQRFEQEAIKCAPNFEPTHRHKKRGSLYRVIAHGRLQVDGDLDMEKVTIYQAEDGSFWVRPDYEFNDGRFDPLESAIAVASPSPPQPARFDMSTFSAENLARCTAPNGFNHPLDLWSLSDWMTATLGELGEAANVLKKLNRVRDGIVGNKETPEELVSMLADEIADAYIYMDLFAVAAGIDLPAAVRTKFDKTSAKIGYQPLAAAEGSDDGR